MTDSPEPRRRTFQDLLDLLAGPATIFIPCGEAATEREILIDADEPRVIDEAIAALTTRDNIYQRGGMLVQVVSGARPLPGIARPVDAPRIAGPVKNARIKELLSAAADWRIKNDEEMKKQHPPDWVVKGIDARGEWPGIRRIEAVVESPVLRADGSMLQTAGYDLATGLLYRPNADFPIIPTTPTHNDAVAARDTLLKVVEDFPWAGEIHKAGWLAAVLTPLARYAFDGPAPLFAVDANVRGTGKSLLVDVVSIITTGRAASRMTIPHGDDEFRKRVLAIALAGEPLILLDNAGTLGSPSLDAALTATTWGDRILGESAIASGVPLYATWYATGNNLILAADTARRTVQIRLDSKEESPEERSSFHHPNLLTWVRQERPRLTAAALTILTAYCAADQPPMSLPAWGSFEAWSDLVRNAVAWVGMGDIGANRKSLALRSDQEAMALRELFVGLYEIDPSGSGMSVAEILRELDKPENSEKFDTLRDALSELCPSKDDGKLNPRSIGQKFRRLRGRVIGGYFLENKNAHNTMVWSVGGGGESGNSGLISSLRGEEKYKCSVVDENKTVPAVEENQTTHTSLTTPGDCPLFGVHRYESTKNGDGREKRECKCGKFYGYVKN